MTGTNHQKFISTLASELDEFYQAARDVWDARSVNSARGASLDNVGAILDYERVVGELDLDYRNGIKNLISINSAAGTKPAIKSFVSNYLRISEDDIVIKEETPNYIQIQLHTDFAPQETEIRQLVQRFIAAGVHVKIVFGGVYWDDAVWDQDLWG